MQSRTILSNVTYVHAIAAMRIHEMVTLYAGVTADHFLSVRAVQATTPLVSEAQFQRRYLAVQFPASGQYSPSYKAVSAVRSYRSILMYPRICVVIRVKCQIVTKVRIKLLSH